MSVFDAPRFRDEAAAHAWVEEALWPQGPVCPRCGGMDRISTVKPNPEKRVRFGLKSCGSCKRQFTVKIGTIFEKTHIPLHVWLQAFHLLASSKKGISAHQLHRTLEITYKSAWFLSHRIREAMRSGDLTPFGSGGGSVEADETYIGQHPDSPPAKRGGVGHKMAVLSLVDRTTGAARSFVMKDVNTKNVTEVVGANLSREARLITDRANVYRRVGATVAGHVSVNHGEEEWVSRADRTVHTNTIEGFFSIFKRGMRGTYQHCQYHHLHRYMAEFDFRYSNRAKLGIEDADRARLALCGVVGKRLMYRAVTARI
jgi:transposase-like protein